VLNRANLKATKHKIKSRQANEGKGKKGGMHSEFDELDFEMDPQLQLTNLNTAREIWAD
jgi:hypothetical protein